jgi:hypothetical protein
VFYKLSLLYLTVAIKLFSLLTFTICTYMSLITSDNFLMGLAVGNIYYKINFVCIYKKRCIYYYQLLPFSCRDIKVPCCTAVPRFGLNYQRPLRFNRYFKYLTL